MNIFIFVVIFLFLSSFSPNLLSLGNYDSCILKHVKGITSDVAAQAIIDICVNKHKDKPSSICIETDANTTNNIIFLKNIDEPLTGRNYCEYPNHMPKSKGGILNGKKSNKWIWWHENGDLGLEINYIEGKRNGQLIKWYNNRDDLIEPISLEGQMQLKENYKDGKKDGKSSSWYPNGQIKLEKNYKDGKKDGKSSSWYPNGQIKLEKNYKDGKKDGKSSSWYMSGQIELKEDYKDGKKDGKSTLWNKSGEILKEEIYKDDLCISGDC